MQGPVEEDIDCRLMDTFLSWSFCFVLLLPDHSPGRWLFGGDKVLTARAREQEAWRLC